MKTIFSILCTILFFVNTIAQTPDSWQQMQPLGIAALPRANAVSFSIGSKGYIGIGSKGLVGTGPYAIKDFWEYDPATNSWTQKADFGGGAREYATGFSIDSKGYIGTGNSGYPNYFSYSDFWEYNPSTNMWTRKADFGGGVREFATGFSINGKGYIGTGSATYSLKNDFWEYDPVTDSWTRKADFGGTARRDATGFSISSKGYIGTGYDGIFPNYKKDFWEYDPAINMWNQKADFGGVVRYGATGFSIGSKGYIGTGYVGGVAPFNNSFWEYNPATNLWTRRADFRGTARNYATGFSIGGKGYIGTGSTTDGIESDFWEYNPVGNTWSQKVDLGGTARQGAVGFSIGSKGYFGTGDNGSKKNDFWEYDVATNAWTQKADFGGKARSNATGFSISSKGYIGTGKGDSNFNSIFYKDLWEYDPAVNAWTQKADFGGGARQGATGFSIGSKGYIGTGLGNSGYYQDFWEYDPDNDSWTQKANLSSGERYKAVGFSIGSKGYIGTGFGNSVYYQDFWEYNPATNLWTRRSDFRGTARSNATGFSIGGKGYIGSGYDGSYSTSYKKDFWEYDPAINTWLKRTDMSRGQERSNATGFSIGNYGYIGFGILDIELKNDWWRYSPAVASSIPVITAVTNIIGTYAIAHWHPVADAVSYTLCISSSADSLIYSCYPPVADTLLQLINLRVATQYNVKVVAVLTAGDSSTWSVPYSFTTTSDGWQQVRSLGISATGRSGAVSFSIGNKGYLGTGTEYGGSKNDFWEYDPPTNVWTQKADFGGEGRQYATGFSIGNKGYIFGGDFWEYDPASNAWTQKTDFGGTIRFGAVGFSIGNKGYIGAGHDNFGADKRDFWEYDPAFNAWTQKTDFGGTVRQGAVGFSIGSKGYIGTGYSYSGYLDYIYHSDFWEYDPSINTWTKKADFGGTPRSGATGFSIGSKGYIGTGGNLQDFWEYNPATDIWTQKADFGGGERYGATGFSIGSKGYIGTGNYFDGNSTVYSKDFWEYDPISNHWTRKANFGGTARKYATGFSIGSKGYIGTGLDDRNKKDFWEYDPPANVWTQKADFAGVARYKATGFSIGNKGYIGTGYTTDSVKNDFWEYNPLTNAWTRKADFGGGARYAATGFSIGSKGYIGTGYDVDHHFTNDFWEYDPATNAWTQKTNFSGTARSDASGFSIGSKGYIGTGNDGYSDKKDFWEYDPATNTWVQKADFGSGKRSESTGFSIGSKGYIGTGGGSASAKDFWEYDPATNTWIQKVNFGGTERNGATGFSVGNSGYIGFGIDNTGLKNDWWQYANVNVRGIPIIVSVTNIAVTKAIAHWYPVAGAISYSVCVARTDSLKYSCYLPVTDTLKQLTNLLPATQYNVQVKAIFGVGDSSVFSVPYTFTTTDSCIAPSNLKVTNITAVAAKLNWKLPLVPVAGFQINYRAVGAGNWIKKQKPYPNTSINLTGLTASTNYEWRILSGCTSSQSVFVSGPNFTTLSAVNYASTTDGIEAASENLGIKVIPNPGNGDFILQAALPAKAAATMLLLYNNMGQKVWQQNAGNISSGLNRNISLRNILSNGVYLFVIERNDIKLSQKIVISK